MLVLRFIPLVDSDDRPVELRSWIHPANHGARALRKMRCSRVVGCFALLVATETQLVNAGSEELHQCLFPSLGRRFGCFDTFATAPFATRLLAHASRRRGWTPQQDLESLTRVCAGPGLPALCKYIYMCETLAIYGVRYRGADAGTTVSTESWWVRAGSTRCSLCQLLLVFVPSCSAPTPCSSSLLCLLVE